MILNKESLNIFDLSDFIIIDCRNVMDQPEATEKLLADAPLSNSTHIPETPFMYTEAGINKGRHPLPFKEQTAALFQTLSQNNKKLLLVSNENSFYHTRLYYLFTLYGFESYLYNDDLHWVEEHHQNFSSYTGGVLPSEEGHSTAFEADIYRSMADVQEAIQDHNVLLIDVRSNERYLGITEPIDFKKGHIPGAVNIPNTQIYQDGLLNFNSLDDHLEVIQEYAEVIVYCGSGMSATPLFTLLNEKGINAKLYGGSFSEWITDDSNTVETKENTL
jgi:thiosulfate/3-mercaptopyruvate sulfurtransferase